jgi:hypothetical protein
VKPVNGMKVMGRLKDSGIADCISACEEPRLLSVDPKAIVPTVAEEHISCIAVDAHKHVVASAPMHYVAPVVADQMIVAVAPEDFVVAMTSTDLVFSSATLKFIIAEIPVDHIVEQTTDQDIVPAFSVKL